MQWIQKHPKASLEMLGYIPSFFSENDPRSAREQINENYQHGGGWRPLKGFKMLDNGIRFQDAYPLPLCFEAKLRNEIIRFYTGA
jgi:hypothetical protein